MSSNDTTPYTIPYTGALGKQIAQGVVPASSLEPGAVAQPPAPQDQDKQQQGYQRPSVANGPSSPETSHAKGETLTMAGDGGCAATSDANSAARRSSVALTTHSGPSDSVPLRFASAAASVGGIAIIHPEHRNSQGIHSSSTSKQDAVNQDEVCIQSSFAQNTLTPLGFHYFQSGWPAGRLRRLDEQSHSKPCSHAC